MKHMAASWREGGHFGRIQNFQSRGESFDSVSRSRERGNLCKRVHIDIIIEEAAV